jgi:hypothetical protein
MGRILCKYWWVVVVAATLVVVGQIRFIARDEGFYLMSAKLISQGALPYRDFFLPQAPLMPYLYGLLFKVCGPSWIAARLFGAMIATGCVWFLYLLARHVYSERAAQFSVVLVTCSAAFQLWIPLAKNVGLALLLLLGALYVFLVKRRFFLAGVLIGLCGLTRFTFAPLAVLFFVPIYKGQFRRQCGSVALGLCPAALVVGLFFLLSPTNFFDDNFTYHLQRTKLDEEGIESNKRYVLLSLLGIRDCIGGGGRQFCFLLLGAFASVWSSPQAVAAHRVLLLCAGLFGILNFIPSPTYVQYFSVLAVLTVAPAAHALERLCEKVCGRGARAWGVLGALLCVVLFCSLGTRDFKRFLITGEKVIGVGAPNHRSWRIEAVRRAGRRIDQLNGSGKPVYVSWPGYLIEAVSTPLPGSENNFGVGWANVRDFSESEEVSRRIASRRTIVKAFALGEIDLVVLFLGRGRTSELQKQIQTHGAKKIDSMGGIAFFRRTP